MFRGLGHLTLAGLLQTYRSKAAIFWMLAFPVFFVVLFGFIFGRGESANTTFIMPGLWTITVISSTFFGASLQMVQERENGIFRRYWVTPLSAVTLVSAFGLVTFVTLIISLVIQGVVAWLLFQIQIHGSMFDLLLVFIAGLAAFIPLGLLVGSMATDMKTAPVITNLLFFPMMFLSGAAFPFLFLPDFIQTIARFLPATYLNEALQGVVVRGEGLSQNLGPIAVLLVTSVVALALNGLLFRWESKQPLSRRNIMLALGGLIAIYTIAALAGPTLRMATYNPGDAAEGVGADEGSGDAGDRSADGTALPDPSTLRGPVTILDNVAVLDGIGGRHPNARVVVRGGRIVSIGSTEGTQPTPADFPDEPEIDVHDWTGRFLTPGFIDARVQLGASGGGQASMAEWTAQRQIDDLQAYLGVGVTTIVSMTDDLQDMTTLRDAVRSGEMRSPRVVVGGPALTARGGFPANLMAMIPGGAERFACQIESPADARACVDQLAQGGADVIQLVRFRGGDPTQQTPVLSADATRAAASVAKEHALPVALHVQNASDVRLALDLGRGVGVGDGVGLGDGVGAGDSVGDGVGASRRHFGIGRLDGMPHALTDALWDSVAAAGVVLAPGLVAAERLSQLAAGVDIDDPLIQRWNDREVVESVKHPSSWITQRRSDPTFAHGTRLLFQQTSAEARAAAGRDVTFVVASHAGSPGVFHGSSYIRELELLADGAGLGPSQILRAATSNAADWMDRADLGRIVPGARADLVVLATDPETSVTAYRTVQAVYLAGKRLDRNALQNTHPGPWLPR